MKSKHAVLIYPRPTQGYSRERRRDIHVVRRVYAPLSVMYLAATLEEAGYPVLLLDHRLDTLDGMMEKISKIRDVLFFGISTMTGSQIINALKIAERLRSLYDKDIPIVWGGIHPTIFPEETVTNSSADIVGYGAGDYTVVEIARAIDLGMPLDTVKGICFKRNGAVIKNPPADNIKQLDDLPFPAWHHLGEHINSAQYPVLATISTSRGCPYSCAYCYKWGAGEDGWRPFTVGRIMEEVDYLNDKFGFDIFEIVDENFILHKPRAIELIRNFKNRNFKISAVRSNFLTYDDAVVDELKGFCDYVAYSPETGSAKIQSLLNKKADYRKMKSLNSKLLDMGIDTVHTFIFGFPFETDDDIRATVNLCADFKRINPASRMAIYQYMPYPKTPLTDMMISKYGLSLPARLEEWGRTDMYGDLDLRFRPWIDGSMSSFLNDFQLVFNTVFNTYGAIDKDVENKYNENPRIRELMGDISAIRRNTESLVASPLNDRIPPGLLDSYKGKIFI